jgi:hypothetical protein
MRAKLVRGIGISAGTLWGGDSPRVRAAFLPRSRFSGYDPEVAVLAIQNQGAMAFSGHQTMPMCG